MSVTLEDAQRTIPRNGRTVRSPLSPLALPAVLALLVAACQPDGPPTDPVDEPAPPVEAPEAPNGEMRGPAEEESDDDATPAAAWHEIAEAPIAPRINHSVTWTGERIVVWGGQDPATGEIAADGAAYDPAIDEWQQVPEAPIEPRWAHEALWTGSELLVFGGSAGPDHLADCYTDGALWDPATGSWREIPPAPGDPRCGAAVAWMDGSLLVFGGHVGQGPPGPGDRTATAVAYDVEAGTWRELADAPLDARADAFAVWADDEVIVYGGHALADDGAGFVFRTDGAAYDPSADTWRELADGPLPPRAGPDGVWTGAELIVLGGDDPDPEVTEQRRPAAAYDPATDAWRSIADEPRGPGTSAVAWADGVVYVLGSGAPPGPDADERPSVAPLVEYLVDDDRWVELPDPPDGPRMHHAMAWDGQSLIVWGGQLEDAPAPGLRWGP